MPAARANNNKPRGTLLGKMLLGFLLLVPLPLAIFGWLAGSSIFRDLRNHSLAENSTLARNIAQLGLLCNNDVLRDLSGLAKSAPAQSHDPVMGRLLARTSIAQEEELASVFLMDETGVNFAGSSPEAARVSAANQPYFISVKRTRRPYISDVRRSIVTGRQTVTYAVPILGPGGRFRGAVAGNIDLKVITRRMARHMQGATARLLVLNSRRQPILAVPPHEQKELAAISRLPEIAQALRKQASNREARNPNNGEAELVSTASIDPMDWKVLIVEDADVAFAATDHLRNMYILYLTLATLVWLVGVALVARHVTRPLGRLTAAAYEISMGNYEASPRVDTNDELQTLGDVMDAMARRIQLQMKELQESRERIQTAIEQIGAALTHPFDENWLMQFILERLAAATHCDYGALLLYDESRNMLVVRAGFNPPEEMGELIGKYQVRPDEGIAGWAYTHAMSTLVTDARKDPRFQLVFPYRERYKVGGMLAVPILYEDKPLGVIDLFSKRVGGFSKEDLRLSEVIANQAGIALRNMRLYEQTQRQLREMRALQEVTQVVSSTLDVSTVLDEGLKKTVEVLEMDNSGGIHLINRESGALEVRAAYGVPHEALEDEFFRHEVEPFLWEVIRTRKLLAIPDMKSDPRISSSPEKIRRAIELRMTAMALFPMIVHGEAIGVLGLTSKEPRDFGTQELEQTQAIANQLALGVQNAFLFEEARGTGEALLRAFSLLGEALTSRPNLGQTLELIAKLAAEQMRVKHCALMLREDHLLVVHAQVGLCNAFREMIRPTIGEGLTGLVGSTRAPLVVRNMFEDPRLLAPEAMRCAGVVSFLGVPIVYRGELMGVLCVFGERERVFSDGEASLLSSFADQAAIAIENARLYEREHLVAAVFQESLLPAPPPPLPGYQIVTRYYPATRGFEVGGDYYDYILVGENRIALEIADVSGKGIQAATYAAMGKYFVRAYAAQDPRPSSVLARVNDALCRFLPTGLFITVVYGILDLDTGEFVYASGGHEPQVQCCRVNGPTSLLNPTGKLLGVVPGESFGEERIQLGPGDMLLLYTDGLSDARHNGQFFGVEGIIRIMKAHYGESADRVVEALRLAAQEFQGGTLGDDMALVLVRALALQGGPDA